MSMYLGAVRAFVTEARQPHSTITCDSVSSCCPTAALHSSILLLSSRLLIGCDMLTLRGCNAMILPSEADLQHLHVDSHCINIQASTYQCVDEAPVTLKNIKPSTETSTSFHWVKYELHCHLPVH